MDQTPDFCDPFQDYWPVWRAGIILEPLEKPQMEPHEEAQRREVYYSGRVQGVGFRYTARRSPGSSP